MTSESRSDSKESSGEESDPGDSEPPSGSTKSSGEGSDPGDSEHDLPLDITGHEDRERAVDVTDVDGDDGASTSSHGKADPGASRTGSNSTHHLERPDGGTEVYTGGETAHQSTGSPAESTAESGPGLQENNAGDEPDEPTVEPVEVLVGLAEDGEIDPWDIDIVAVTDKFLERLDEGDLRTSGRALFYASVLLRMKSDAMLEADDDPADEEPWADPWETAMAEERPAEPDPFAAMEAEMDRRLERKRARGMPRTLDELVRDLREAERNSWWKESREYDTSDSPSGFARGTQELDYRLDDDRRMAEEPTAADVTERVHDEHMEETVADVLAAVREHYEKGRDEVLYREVANAGGSRVQTFLGLLFLAHRGQVHLSQDELFGDLWIQDPTAVAGPGEAIAD